jgi:hypothetical protein
MRKKTWCRLAPVIALTIMVAFPQTASAVDVNEDNIKAVLQTMNDQLAAAGKDFRIAYVDLEVCDRVGMTVYANDRQHQLDSHWFPYDPWRFGTRDIYWATDHVDQTTDVPWADAVTAIGRAMNTWNTVPCAYIPLVQVNDYGLDLGYVQYLLGMGGVDGWLADITHAGFLPGIFFDIIGGPGGSDSILGVTFTFTWTAYPDRVAFKEIYENDKFNWGIDIRYFDIETVVAHEVGHGLSLGHFGKIFRTKNGKLHFAPRALMNAIYYDILHELLGTDNASFCSIWASWPNN